MIVKLVVASGKSAGRAIAIKRNKLLIGRAEECDVRPLSEDVSRRHCAITVGPADVWVEDLGSRNGTFVNGAKIAERTRANDGDIVRVGALELKVSISMPAQSVGGGSDDDVSRWLMADDHPAGLSDTTRAINPQDSVAGDATSIHGGPAEPSPEDSSSGSFVTGMTSPATTEQPGATPSAIEAAKAAKSDKPGGLPPGAKKPQADSSRAAAADALRKFFERK